MYYNVCDFFIQILQVLKTRKSHGVSLDEVLSLLLYTVSLSGPEAISQKDEYTLVNLLSQALVDDKEKLSDTLIDLGGMIKKCITHKLTKLLPVYYIASTHKLLSRLYTYSSCSLNMCG